MKKILILISILFISGCHHQVPSNDLSLEKKSMENTSTSLPAKDGISKKETSSEIGSEEKQVKSSDLASQYSQAIIKTSMGDITVEFYGEDSPLTVNNFLNLAKDGFYDNTLFHRVIPDFMLQAGDPLSKQSDWSRHGTGGPGYQFEDEINNHKIVRGSFAMANSGPNTNGSQFFIVTAPATPHLDGRHTNFGYVVDGMDTVDKIEKVKTNEMDHPLENIIIHSIELVK